MANYHQIKNAAILTPTTNTDLGSDSNRYSNVYMSGNIVMSNGVTVTSSNVIAPRVVSITYPGTETATDTAGGQTIVVTGSGFNNTGGTPSVIVGSSVAPSVTYISSTSISFTTPALGAGTYLLYVINADGGTATYLTGISYSGTPTWTTSAGSLGTFGTSASVNISVAATGDTPITYVVKAGSSLPSGLSLNTNTGAITGTGPSPASQTTYNFTLTAKDGQNQSTDRTFNLTVFTTPSTIEYLVVAGGGGGGRGSQGTSEGTGGGAGGMISVTDYSIIVGTLYTITVGDGGATDTQGQNSSAFGTTATGGGNGTTASANAGNGGSGGGSYAGSPGTGVAGPPRQGYNGGQGTGYGGTPGGGGGAGGAGNPGGTLSGQGGVGREWPTGSGTYYAGGGGGTAGLGGNGGGGRGNGGSAEGTAGTANTGGGGGGGGNSGNRAGGAGGKGVVIIRYSSTYSVATSTTGSPTITTPGDGYRYYKFTSSGSITF